MIETIYARFLTDFLVFIQIMKHLTDDNLSKFNEKYNTVYEHNDLLGYPVWKNIFEHAKFQKDEIMSALNKTVYFSDPKDLEPYEIIFHYSQYEPSVFDEAVKKLNQQISDRVFTKPDELLFIFSLQFMLSKFEVINKDNRTIERECIEYIDSIDFLNEFSVGELFQGIVQIAYKEGLYKNYAYWGDSALLENIREHLTDTLNQTLKNKSSEIADELLDLVENDCKSFYEKLFNNDIKIGVLKHFPVLHLIDPQQFVDGWLKNTILNWDIIKSTLDQRIKFIEGREEFSAEGKWMLDVVKVLKSRMNQEKGIRKKQISLNIPNVKNLQPQ